MKVHLSNMGGPSYEVASVARAFAHQLRRPSALDAGSGDGRNSMYLAELGFDVTAVEQDKKLSDVLAKNSNARELAIDVFNEDLQNFVPSKEFDLVLFLGILHFLPRQRLSLLLEQYRACTSSEGVHIITISHDDSGVSASDFLNLQGHINSVDRNLIRSSYSSWDEIAYERYIKFDFHNNGIVDRHPIEKFVFQNESRRKRILRASKVHLVDSYHGNALFDSFEPKMLTSYNYGEVCDRFDMPEHIICTETVEGQYSLLGSEAHDQSVAFWGRTKCYFEGEILVGLARYDTNVFHSDFLFHQIPEE